MHLNQFKKFVKNSLIEEETNNFIKIIKDSDMNQNIEKIISLYLDMFDSIKKENYEFVPKIKKEIENKLHLYDL